MTTSLLVLSLLVTAEPQVKTYGQLRAVMHERDFAPKVTLAAVLKLPHAHAVGALAGLRGEITILDGVAWVAYPAAGGTARVERVTKSDENAALLVAASVPRWKRVELDRAIPFAELDAALEVLAKEHGIDTAKPFPFSVIGTVEDLAFHVIDGTKLPARGGSHGDHARAGVSFSRDKAAATLVGFFSKSHHGVFTHMGSNTHIHVVLSRERASGHVDRVRLAPGATVLLPR